MPGGWYFYLGPLGSLLLSGMCASANAPVITPNLFMTV
jgi:hypothetical protein